MHFAPRNLQFLDQIGCPGEQDAPAVLDQREADSRREVALASARRIKRQDVGALGY